MTQENEEKEDSTREKEDEELTKADKREKRQTERAKRRRERKEKIKAKKWWHPLRILRGIGLFLLTIIKIIFFPYVYAYWKIRDTAKFLSRNDTEDLDRTLISKEDGDEIAEGYIDEKGFLRSLPMFYFIAGTLGAIIAILISFEFMDPVWAAIRDFFVNFSWAEAWALFVDIFEAIWGAIKTVALFIWDILVYLFSGQRFWVPLSILVALGVGIVIIAVIFSEVEFTGKILRKIKAFFKAIFTFTWIINGYHAFQNAIGNITFGKKKLKFYQKRFFYRIVIYSSIITLWIVVTVITLVIASEAAENIIVLYELVYPIALVLIGFANGLLLIAFLSWLIDKLSGDKYVALPEELKKFEEEKQKAKEEKKKQKSEKKQKTA